MEFIILIIVVVGLLLFLNSKLKNKNPDELSPDQKKFVQINENISDTVIVNLNKVKKFTEKKISIQFITSGIWRLVDSENILYTFRNNGEILITRNGTVKRGTYEYIIDNNSLIITEDNITKMFYIINLKNDNITLKDISNNKIYSFFNETKLKDIIILEDKKHLIAREKSDYYKRQSEES